jgi:hypothetical protein
VTLTATRAFSASDAAVTFNRDVAPIVFNHCATCHRPGEVAPFTLASYRDVSKRAQQIAEVVESRYMPPWKAGGPHGQFVGDRRLTGEQIRTIRAWVDAGAPEGDAADLPPLPQFAEGWQLGQPDLVVTTPEPFTVPAEGRDVYHCFVVPLDLPQDVYVTALELRPSNRKVVHHTLLYLDANGAARALDAASPGPGYPRVGGPGFLPTGGLGGWAPGVSPRHLPDGVGRPVKKGSDLILHTHFHPSGKPESEQTSVGLYFAKRIPAKVLATIPRGSRNIDIAPGESDYTVRDSFTVPADVTLAGLFPHAHLICKSIRVTATFADGEERQLISIKDWDWDWQDQYQYADPIQVPRGTRVDMEFVYDNSAGNPENPSNPPKRVRFGEQTTDEMAFVFFHILTDRGAEGLAFRGGRRARGGNDGWLMRRLLERFDANKNGRLDRDEREAARRAFPAGGARGDGKG